MQSFKALLICFVVIFSLSLFSGAMFSGYQLDEDYELFEIKTQLDAGNGLFSTIAQYTRHDHMRMRIYYLFRILQVAVFGANVHFFRFILAVLGSVTCFGFYRFARSLDLSFIEALIFSLLILCGAQSMIWWRMGTAENIGMFFVALALASISTRPSSSKSSYKQDLIFIVCLTLASFSKESFIVSVPALLYLKVLQTRRMQCVSWKDAFIRNITPIIIMSVIVASQIVFIIFVTGSVVAGYVGFEGVRWESLSRVFLGLLRIHSWAIGGLFTIFFTRWAISRGSFFLKSFKEIIYAVVFFLMMSIPTALLFQKSGLNQNYILPNAFASVFCLGVLYRVIRDNEKRVLHILASFFVIATMIGAIRGSWIQGQAFASQGNVTQELVDSVSEGLNQDDIIVFALDPARNMEWGWGLKIYLAELAETENVYLFPLFRQNYSEFEKYLIKDHPDNIIKRFIGRLPRDIKNPKKIKTVVVFPYSGLWFLKGKPSWFDRGEFNLNTIGRFIVFRKKA